MATGCTRRRSDWILEFLLRKSDEVLEQNFSRTPKNLVLWIATTSHVTCLIISLSITNPERTYWQQRWWVARSKIKISFEINLICLTFEKKKKRSLNTEWELKLQDEYSSPEVDEKLFSQLYNILNLTIFPLMEDMKKK